MNFYLIVLFLHILGAVGLFLGLGIEGTVLKSLRSVKLAYISEITTYYFCCINTFVTIYGYLHGYRSMELDWMDYHGFDYPGCSFWFRKYNR